MTPLRLAAEPMTDEEEEAEGALSAQDRARLALAREWLAANPQTPEEIAQFYRDAQSYGADLDAWHATPDRAEVTRMLVHVATTSKVERVVDIGAGAGHDLAAIRAALPEAALHAVEPNARLRARLAANAAVSADVAAAPIEAADLLICLDVLEHIPDPETFLGDIAARAPLGCLLYEMSATHDQQTPLHLKANRGWQSGRVLERMGWLLIDQADRIHVWRRVALAGPQRASLLLCAYRSVTAQTMESIMGVTGGVGHGWRLRAKLGDALIARSRSIIVTKWWQETNDDVFLMVDDDIVFQAGDADRIVEWCRAGYDIICGAYPVHNGAHLACRPLPGTDEVIFGPQRAPQEIQYAATGFMAVHRRVIDALIAKLPLCHPSESWSFYPLFQATVAEDGDRGDHIWLSEDYGFSQMAHEAGFKIWLDLRTKLIHLGQSGISVSNMSQMHAAMHAV